jgi:hypothetical protein
MLALAKPTVVYIDARATYSANVGASHDNDVLQLAGHLQVFRESSTVQLSGKNAVMQRL